MVKNITCSHSLLKEPSELGKKIVPKELMSWWLQSREASFFPQALPVVKTITLVTENIVNYDEFSIQFGSIPVAGDPQNVHPIPCWTRGWSERSPLARDFVMRLLRLIFENVFFFPCGAKEERCQPTKTRWWFQIFFIFTLTWGRFPIWLIFFEGVEITNQFTMVYPPWN